jgi:2-O-A-mannosyl-D-glycerate-specific PTS system IIC component
MKLSKLLITQNIDLDVNLNKKEDVLAYMAKLLFLSKRISDIDEFYKDLIKRENEESTNMDIGVAIPHSHSQTVKKSTVSIVKLRKPIKWDDHGEEVQYIFMLAASAQDKDVSHLELISKIAELLIDDEFIAFLDTNKEPQLLINKIEEMIGGE